MRHRSAGGFDSQVVHAAGYLSAGAGPTVPGRCVYTAGLLGAQDPGNPASEDIVYGDIDPAWLEQLIGNAGSIPERVGLRLRNHQNDRQRIICDDSGQNRLGLENIDVINTGPEGPG